MCRGKGAERKAFDDVIDADEQATEAEAGEDAVSAAMNDFGPILADRVTKDGAKAQKENADNPERHKLW